jgi:hypothetical protein
VKAILVCYNFQQGGPSLTRINVDTAAPAVKKFLRSLAIDANGVELTLGGNVFCKIIPPGQLSDAEKAAQLAEVRDLLGEARENSKRFAAATVEQNIRNALKTIRKGR